jgi:RHS repeat-associated protein
LRKARLRAVPKRRYYPEGEDDIADNQLLYYGRDHLGSVRDVIAMPSGATVNHFDYDPFGAPVSSTGSALTATDLRYGGLFYHAQSGLYLATYRAYDPSLGRWLSRDPIPEIPSPKTEASTSMNTSEGIRSPTPIYLG